MARWPPVVAPMRAESRGLDCEACTRLAHPGAFQWQARITRWRETGRTGAVQSAAPCDAQCKGNLSGPTWHPERSNAALVDIATGRRNQPTDDPPNPRVREPSLRAWYGSMGIRLDSR